MSSSYLGFPINTVIVFIIMLFGSIFIDLFVHRHNEAISLKSAIIWSLFWVFIAIDFTVFLYIQHGAEMAGLFFSGYLLEKILSSDNLFVMMAIFSWFQIPDKYRHRVLYYGILGSIIFRGIFVTIGTFLINLGPYVEFIFGIIIGLTAIIMILYNKEQDEIKDYSKHLAYRLVTLFYPIYPTIRNHKFFLIQKEIDVQMENLENEGAIYIKGNKEKRYATPLLLCVAVVELSDIIFALDSVPSIIAISREPLIIYSAIMFAILGLRSFYFVLEALQQSLVHLKKTMIFLLFFVAFKLGLNSTDHFWHHGYKIGVNISFLVIFGMLVLGIISSIIFPGRK